MTDIAACLCATAFAVAAALPGQAQNIGGLAGVEMLSFAETGLGPEQINRLNLELRLRDQLSRTLSYDVRLFGSINQEDSEGTYIDPTVAKFSWQSGNWQAELGYDIVHWGVAESQNVVNIINQRDQIRDLRNDLALGQPMATLRHFGASWTAEAYVLPRFRELNFGANERRWGIGLPVNDDSSTFESPAGHNHVDFAFRMSGNAGDLEYGVSAFDGTLRRPELALDALGDLTPKYVQARQYGVDLQYTWGATLFKFEGIHVDRDSGESSRAAVYGVEHVVGGVFGTPWEATLFAEHNFDSRGSAGPSAYQDDLFLGLRLNFANTRDTWLTLGGFRDLQLGGVLGTIEVESRLTHQLSLNAGYVFVDADDPEDALSAAREFDHVSIGVQWNF